MVPSAAWEAGTASIIPRNAAKIAASERRHFIFPPWPVGRWRCCRLFPLGKDLMPRAEAKSICQAPVTGQSLDAHMRHAAGDQGGIFTAEAQRTPRSRDCEANSVLATAHRLACSAFSA